MLSTLPAIATTLLGVLAGMWLRRGDVTATRRVARLAIAGGVLALAGLAASAGMPINKHIWTSSYVLYTGGLACVALAACVYAIEVRGARAAARPLALFGRHAIGAFVGAGMMAVWLARAKVAVAGPGGERTLRSLKPWLMERAFEPALSPANASLAFAIAFVSVWYVLVVLLDRRGWVLKI
jgi:predicted acyltransferase